MELRRIRIGARVGVRAADRRIAPPLCNGTVLDIVRRPGRRSSVIVAPDGMPVLVVPLWRIVHPSA